MRNVVMAAMLVAAGISSNYVPRTSGSDNAAEAVAKGEKTVLSEAHLPQPIDDPFTLLKDYLHPDPQDYLHPDDNALVCPLDSKSNKPDLNFMIATVPDPERTHLGLYFDRFLESIILAAEEAGFSYDRYWIPWHVSHDPNSAYLNDQDTLDARGEGRHRRPGIIIFRETHKSVSDPNSKTDDQATNGIPKTLVIFLVGETPTSGINRHQFLEIVDYLGRTKNCDKSVRILGPTFSGSATSLKLALDAIPNRGHTEVISGSASGLGPLEAMARTTIHSDGFVPTVLYSFLKSQIHFSGDFAVVREAGTDYGAALTVGFGSNPGIYYPRELSRLRNAFPEQANSAATEISNVQQQLSLRLRDSRTGEDTLPQFSDQTPVTQESVILQISETLRRDHVGLAVITGTDVLDVMFLSRHLRELNPDVRLVLWNSDLLFVHGTDTLDFVGMLAINTYPLIPANLDWTASKRPHYYFQSDMAEGVYNACRLLLNPAAADLREYSAPGANNSTRPPLWLSVIGHDAYWPLSFIEDNSSRPDPLMLDAMQPPPNTEQYLDPGWPTRVWGFVFYGCSLLASLYVATYFYVLWERRYRGCLPRWCSLLHPRPYDAPPFWRADYSSLISLSLWLAYLTLFLPLLRLGFQNPGANWRLMLWVGVVVTSGLLVATALGLFRFSSWILGAAGLVLAGAMVWLLFPFSDQTFFRALRSVQPGSGVAPNLPLFLLLLAFAWWASIEVQRARLITEYRPQMSDIVGHNAGTNIACLDGWLNQGFLHIDWSGWVVALIGTAAAALITLPHILSVDGRLFDAIICALVIPLAALLFFSTNAFLRIWRSLYRVLEALESHPIRSAFSNLPDDVSWSPLFQYGARRKTYTLVIRSLESLRALHECAPNYYPGLNADIEQLDHYISEILEDVHRGLEEPLAVSDGLQACLLRITGELSNALQAKGWNSKGSETVHKIEEACNTRTVRKGFAKWFDPHGSFEIRTESADLDPAEKPDLLAAEIVALRYLAYMRYIMRHLRNILSFLTTGFILLTLAVNCYPFQALNILRWSITFTFVLIAIVLVYVFQQMSRNEILSRITDTKAGSLDSSFYLRIVSVGALPVLAVIASHFPSVGRFLFSWVQPAISALH